MEQESTFSVPEIVGIATAGAAALGGVIVALSRAQSHDARPQAPVAGASEAVGAGLERGMDAARHATQLLAERLPTLRESAAERLPALKEAASDRLARVGERIPLDAERVGAVASAGVEQARAAGATLLERVQESVVPAVTSAVDSVSDAASSAAHSAQPREAVGGVLDSVGAGAGRAVDASTNLVREALATLFWLVAASGLVYMVLLSPERRERLKRFVFGAIEETRLLIKDFRGYEEDI